MNNSELCSMIEAILFAAGEPVPFERLCRGAACEPIELAAALDDLAGMYSFDRRGIRLVRVNDTAQLATAPEYAEQVRAALEMRRAPAPRSRRWKCWPLSRRTSRRHAPILNRCAGWTAPIRWAF